MIIGVTAEWKDGEVVLTGNDKARVYAIGSTPIVSKDYDPNCMVSYIAGFIRKMTSQEALDERRDLSIVQVLIINADCVDKAVITEMIGLGLHFLNDLDSTAQVFNVLCTMLLPQKRPSDIRFAFAIRAGLIEMCLTFIDRFGMNKSFERSFSSLTLLNTVFPSH